MLPFVTAKSSLNFEQGTSQFTVNSRTNTTTLSVPCNKLSIIIVSWDTIKSVHSLFIFCFQYTDFKKNNIHKTSRNAVTLNVYLGQQKTQLAYKHWISDLIALNAWVLWEFHTSLPTCCSNVPRPVVTIKPQISTTSRLSVPHIDCVSSRYKSVK